MNQSFFLLDPLLSQNELAMQNCNIVRESSREISSRMRTQSMEQETNLTEEVRTRTPRLRGPLKTLLMEPLRVKELACLIDSEESGRLCVLVGVESEWGLMGSPSEVLPGDGRSVRRDPWRERGQQSSSC